MPFSAWRLNCFRSARDHSARKSFRVALASMTQDVPLDSQPMVSGRSSPRWPDSEMISEQVGRNHFSATEMSQACVFIGQLADAPSTALAS